MMGELARKTCLRDKPESIAQSKKKSSVIVDMVFQNCFDRSGVATTWACHPQVLRAHSRRMSMRTFLK